MTINQIRICSFIAAYANGQIPVVPIQVVPAPIDPIVIAPSTIPINPTVATVTNIILQSTTAEPLSITETATLSLSTAIAPDWVDTTVIGDPASQKVSTQSSVKTSIVNAIATGKYYVNRSD
jgi:hypothetical protein